MSNLFRSQAVKWQYNRLYGDVLILPRISHMAILGFLLLCMATVIWWLTTSTYARKETITGWLEPPKGVIKIYAGDTGIIKRVMIKEGEMVLKDQPLFIVSGGHFLENGSQLESRLLDGYKSQQRLLKEQLEFTVNLYQRHRLDVQRKISAIERDITIMDEQLHTLNARYELVKAQAGRQQALHEKGFVSETVIDNTVGNELALQNEQQVLIRDKINRRNDVAQLRSELDSLPDQNANKIIQIRARMSEVAQNIAQLYGQSSYIIKAIKQGLVTNLQAQVGQKVYAGSGIPLMTIIPSGTGLSAHLLAPVRSAGFIEPGQEMDIRYDAYPYQKFGLYKGKVISVSDTVLMPNELLNTPLRIQEPVYRITAQLQRLKVRAYGKEFPLKAGMTLSADVRLGERTLLQWMFDPFYSLRGHL